MQWVSKEIQEKIFFPPQGSPQVRGPRSLRSGNRDELRQNEIRAIQYGQNNANMNQRKVSTLSCFLCGGIGHFYGVCNTYHNMQPRGEKCQQCNGQHLPAL